DCRASGVLRSTECRSTPLQKTPSLPVRTNARMAGPSFWIWSSTRCISRTIVTSMAFRVLAACSVIVATELVVSTRIEPMLLFPPLHLNVVLSLHLTWFLQQRPQVHAGQA